MKLGVAIPQRSWPSQGNYTYREATDYATRAEALGFDSVWISDHYFLDFGGPRQRVGPEAMTALSFVAAATESIALGTMVLCAPLRPPGQLVREATTLDELSGGRFTLGLGAGWHAPEFEAFGIRFDSLYSRFEEYVEIVAALLAGGPVDYDGRFNTLVGGEVLGGSRPRLLVAGSGPRMLALAARLADAWSLPGSYERMPEMLETLRSGELAAGRPAGSVAPSCGAAALLVDRDAADRLLADQPPTSPVAVGADGLRQLVWGIESAGADEVILHFSGAVWTSYGIEQLDLAAEALGL
jgi:alkanesulfonate monooxygenase SsuD/methylene tetrahydromethanopterin reductase-like flavin-dependent oxidoreductase (luciferase family)